MYYLLFAVIATLFSPVFVSAQERVPATSSTTCGFIIIDDVNHPYDCDNPFRTNKYFEGDVSLSGVPLTPHTIVSLAEGGWTEFAIDAIDDFSYRGYLLKKEGNNYRMIQKNIFNTELTTLQKILLSWRYYESKNISINYSLLREVVPNLPDYILAEIGRFREFSSNKIQFSTGEYVLIIEKDHPMLTRELRLNKLLSLFTPIAYAQSYMPNVSMVPFAVEVGDDRLPEPYLAQVFIIDPEYEGLVVEESARDQYAKQAADNAVYLTELAQKESAQQGYSVGYRLGAKGWDYVEQRFVAAEEILSGYYWRWDKPFNNGIDCSGLVAWAYNRAFDPSLPFVKNFISKEGTDGQFRLHASETHVDESALLPGDTMYFNWANPGEAYQGHVVMYVGDRGDYDIVHAESYDSGLKFDTVENYLNPFRSSKKRGTRRLTPNNPKLLVTTKSPVHLTVIDPLGNKLSYNDMVHGETEITHEVSGELYYDTSTQGHDGEPEDTIFSPKVHPGVYTIIVTPSDSAAVGDTFSVVVEVTGKQKYLAKDVSINDTTAPTYHQFTAMTEAEAEQLGVPKTDITYDKLVKPIVIKSVLKTSPTIDTTDQSVVSTQPGSSLQATRVRDRQFDAVTKVGEVAGATTSFNTPVLGQWYDIAVNEQGVTYHIKKLVAEESKSTIIFNQISTTTYEVLLFVSSNDAAEVPDLVTLFIKNNTLATLEI